MFTKNVALLGVSLFALVQAVPALAVPSLATDASVQINRDPALNAIPSTGTGYSFSGVSASAPLGSSSGSASASSDTNYNTRAASSVQSTGIASSNAQWFETIANATASSRRYSFTFRIDGGSLDINSAADLMNGNATSGFEAFIDISRTGISSNIFGVTRQVGFTTTAGNTVYSNFATNNYLSLTSGTLLDSAVISGSNNIRQGWSTSFFTVDLGELAAGESFTLSYLLRSFTNSTVLDLEDCSQRGYGYGYGEGLTSCIFTSTRTGDPGEFLSNGDPSIGFSSTAVSTDVPEPASLALLGIGLAGMGAARRRAKAA